MVVIRLRRAGSKKRPFFRVVATDSRFARDGRFIEILGHYNPRTQPAIVRVNQERVDYWLQRGAQPSDSVRTLIARHLSPAQEVTKVVRVVPAEEAPVASAEEAPVASAEEVPPVTTAKEP
jgi:small subunit ribosomal protein S16